ncbi:hypothetical protein DEO72_LG2g2666 [Vigna unguiculata]|uniref:Uncharacterized protein n=1 Tax=Vigna unguiculata TaxID=3917 RepID=A0A4D6L1F4_VIGUN|nr:hypothetical protein DEO72_LG2g2666 [Vigna unguiculata]
MMAAAVVAAFSSPAKARRWMLEGALQRPLSMAVRTAALVRSDSRIWCVLELRCERGEDNERWFCVNGGSVPQWWPRVVVGDAAAVDASFTVQ